MTIIDPGFGGGGANFKAFTGNFNVEDTATKAGSGTPITIPGTGAFIQLTNDGLGPLTTAANAPTGMSPLWRPSTDDFSFAQLASGDQVFIRIDLDVIAPSPNTEVRVRLEAGIGVSAFPVKWDLSTHKGAGTFQLSRTSFVTMDTVAMMTGTAQFQLASDTACTVAVNGWNYIVNRRSI